MKCCRGPLVGTRRDGSRRSDHTDLAVARGGRGGPHPRLDHADDRDLEVVPQFVEGDCGRRVAGDDDHLHVLDPDQVLGDLPAEPPNLRGRTGPVRIASGVADVDDLLIAQQVDECARDREAAKSAIENADGSVVHLPDPGYASASCRPFGVLALSEVDGLLRATTASRSPDQTSEERYLHPPSGDSTTITPEGI